jgi:hypothetical protein
MLDLYRLNYTRNEGTHDCDSLLFVTSEEDHCDDELNEVRAKVESIQVHHAAHLVKNGLLCIIDAYSKSLCEG